MVAIAEEIGPDLSCVLLPVGSVSLLIPSACIAEVVPWRRVRDVPDTPSWLLGAMAWRGDNIPVLRFDALNVAADVQPVSDRCVAVMNRSHYAAGQPFYALVAAGLPRMVQVNDQDLMPDKCELGRAEAARATLGAEQISLPDLGYIEDQLAELARALH
jgi:chemosensory pili system protein ChpC